MANNYTHFSFMLPRPDSQTRDDLEAFVALYKAEAAAAEAANEETWQQNYSGINYQVEPKGIWVSDRYGEGNVDAAVAISRRYLTHFGLENSGLILEWACTCSKPRLGEFFGGAILVTVDEEGEDYVVHPALLCEQEAQRRQITLL